MGKKLENIFGIEADILKEVSGGDYRRFGKLIIDDYLSRITSIAYRIIGNHSDSEDIAMEVFSKIYKGARSYDPSKTFFTWLYRITVNTSIDWLRAKKRNVYPFSDLLQDELVNIEDTNGNNPYNLLIREENRKLINEAMDEVCTNIEQRLLFLYYEEELEYGEISELFGKNKDWTRYKLWKTREKIKKYVQVKENKELRRIERLGK